ncbi:MAG: hypothetical protein U0271_36455 [Polyangiaceae bacterium]
MAAGRALAISFTVLAIGCSGADETSEVPENSASASAQPSTTASAQPSTTASTQPSTTAATQTASAQPSASSSGTSVAAKKGTCLMWQVCGCNLGCGGVAVDAKSLKPGMRVKVISGQGAGDEAFIAKAPQQGGGEVLSLGRDEPGRPGVCDARKASPFMGFACATKDSGPVPKNACASGCSLP